MIELCYKWDSIGGKHLFGLRFPKGYKTQAKLFLMFYIGSFMEKDLNAIVEPNPIFRGEVIGHFKADQEIRPLANRISKAINNNAK